MDMQAEILSAGIAKVVLVGRLDVTGADKIDLQFNAIAGSNKGLIVDMTGVDFLASIGIRTLLLGAKTIQRRGGHLVLLSPQADVVKVLEISGMLDLMPVVDSMDAALAKVGG
jgi:anti-sigma B factor antagonist